MALLRVEEQWILARVTIQFIRISIRTLQPLLHTSRSLRYDWYAAHINSQPTTSIIMGDVICFVAFHRVGPCLAAWCRPHSLIHTILFLLWLLDFVPSGRETNAF